MDFRYRGLSPPANFGLALRANITGVGVALPAKIGSGATSLGGTYRTYGTIGTYASRGGVGTLWTVADHGAFKALMVPSVFPAVAGSYLHSLPGRVIAPRLSGEARGLG